MKGKPKLVHTLSKKVREVYEDRDDRIVAYLCGKCELEELTNEDQIIIKRTLATHQLMCKGYTNYKIAQIHERIFGYTRPVVYADIRRATRLLGRIDGSSEESRWAWLWEVAKEKHMIHQEHGDIKEAAMYFKELVKIAEHYKSEPLEAEEANQFILNLTLKNGETRELNLDDLKDIKDIPYEDVIEGIEQETYSDAVLKNLLTPDAEKGA